ncbi:MAG: hypothetical protein KDJ52_21320 [Anaerolineae bacterium]|nr:hypothetical protein [Anaerolineae bacterium]
MQTITAFSSKSDNRIQVVRPALSMVEPVVNQPTGYHAMQTHQKLQLNLRRCCASLYVAVIPFG